MGRASEAFDQLSDECDRRAKDLSGALGPTWLELAAMFREAAESIADAEYQDRMGDDM